MYPNDNPITTKQIHTNLTSLLNLLITIGSHLLNDFSAPGTSLSTLLDTNLWVYLYAKHPILADYISTIVVSTQIFVNYIMF
ncbi:MAG: PIN domain-containing protein [Symploca sp. SIO2D2]|nr:PIN domain-containing protein [Symploca sp. SIO2D2]